MGRDNKIRKTKKKGKGLGSWSLLLVMTENAEMDYKSEERGKDENRVSRIGKGRETRARDDEQTKQRR